MNKHSKKVKVSLNEEEKRKLEHNAALCGLPQSEYLRQICLGKEPHAKPPAEFWELMDAIYNLHNQWKQLLPFYPEAAEECRRLENLILFLQKEVA